MRILVLGSGAREHALIWKISLSSEVTAIFCAPGNAGTSKLAQNLKIKPTDLDAVLQAAKDNSVDLVVIGPEGPLAAGIVDHFQPSGIPIFGPSKAAARLESSKVFAKNLLEKSGIPCPKGISFDSFPEALRYIGMQDYPVVVKADGLAAGKGVVIARSHPEAVKALKDMMVDRVFGPAGDRVLIEECVQGKEVSLLAFSDGRTVVPMVPACDYKRVDDGDQGPNTGGMGSYSPPGFFDAAMTRQIAESVLTPTINAMAATGAPYRGVLYAGLMLTDRGPLVLEFNARFGDPETQVIMPRLKTDIVRIFSAVVGGTLDRVPVEWTDEVCVGTVMASGGYPGEYPTGLVIKGLDTVDPNVMVFHAGTRTGEDGRIYTDGGRVLTVTSTGKNMIEARTRVYDNLSRINFEGAHYRKDIAAREVS